MTHRLNHGYYGKLFERRPDDQLVVTHITADYDPRLGLFEIVDRIQAEAINRRAASYQLWRHIGSDCRPQGCMMMLASSERRARRSA